MIKNHMHMNFAIGLKKERYASICYILYASIKIMAMKEKRLLVVKLQF